MKHFFVSLFLAVQVFATQDYREPITNFEEGYFVGHGQYYKNTGERGDIYSFVEVYENQIKVYKTVDNKVFNAKLDFNFTENGFFKVTIEKNDLTSGETYNYEGKGYCVSNACHTYVKLGEIGFMEDTILFNEEGDINKVGSLHIPTGQDDDGNPIVTVITWEEKLFWIKK